MKICFIQKQLFPYFGVMAVSSAVKRHGYKTDVLIQACESDILKSLEEIEPDVVGFSVLSSEHRWLKELTKVGYALDDTYPQYIVF